MATSKQKEAAKENLKKARSAQSGRGSSKSSSKSKSTDMSTAEKNDLPKADFAFPKQRKEPLNDAKHVRNAIARFDQVEGVTDAERESAWKRILAAAKRFDVEVSAADWRELTKGGKAKPK